MVSEVEIDAALDQWFARPDWREVYADGPPVRDYMRRALEAAYTIHNRKPFPHHNSHVDAYIRVLKTRLADETERAYAATEKAARAACITAGEDPDMMVIPGITMPQGYTKPAGPPRPWWTFKADEMAKVGQSS